MSNDSDLRLPSSDFQISRRGAIRAGALVAAGAWSATACSASAASPLKLATFTAEVTPPLGHPLMGGGIEPAKEVVDPLFIRGLVLSGRGEPVVLASIEWCEIRNDAFERWRAALSEAAGTTPQRVVLSSVHVHDAPIADLAAQRLLEERGAAGAICDLEFHERAVERAAQAAGDCLASARPVTHFGVGQAKVDRVASNRRYVGPDGKPAFNRMSRTVDAVMRERPEGTVDPWLKMISFFDGDRPLAALSTYATHPMSYYGKGGVSADFVGLARHRRQMDDPAVFQIYASGCSGNVTAGKYNDGDPANRPLLADRIYEAMRAASEATQKYPLEKFDIRGVELDLKPRSGPGFSIDELEERLKTDPQPFGQCLAALGLSWRRRADSGRKIDVPVLDLGPAQLVLLPAEAYVEFQLLAQKLRPDSFVAVLGYGECGPGYIPIERAFLENDGNLRDWCWVDPGAEEAMTSALTDALVRHD